MSIGSNTPPDEDRLKALIAEAHEQLPEPDAWKLKELEERLNRQLGRVQRARKPSAWAWWLVGALLAASAAAWWTYETWREPATGVEQVVPVMPEQGPAGQRPGPAKAEGAGKQKGGMSSRRETPPTRAPAEQRNPRIYQRELP